MGEHFSLISRHFLSFLLFLDTFSLILDPKVSRNGNDGKSVIHAGPEQPFRCLDCIYFEHILQLYPPHDIQTWGLELLRWRSVSSSGKDWYHAWVNTAYMLSNSNIHLQSGQLPYVMVCQHVQGISVIMLVCWISRTLCNKLPCPIVKACCAPTHTPTAYQHKTVDWQNRAQKKQQRLGPDKKGGEKGGRSGWNNQTRVITAPYLKFIRASITHNMGETNLPHRK